ncbi:MAG: tyrosine-type recombinase/integrase [Thermodesulfovibrionales bacterium]|jgi:integrase
MAIYQKGKHWYIDYYHNGNRRRKKVGTSKKPAETVLSDVQVKIVKEEYLGILEEKKVLFKEFSEIYKEFSKTNKTHNSYARDLTSLNGLQPIFESRYLFEVIPQSGAGKYLSPIVIIALNTGLRKQEILKMKRKNIDFNERKITVNCAKTKEIRILPMNESVYQELKRVPQHIDSELDTKRLCVI